MSIQLRFCFLGPPLLRLGLCAFLKPLPEPSVDLAQVLHSSSACCVPAFSLHTPVVWREKERKREGGRVGEERERERKKEKEPTMRMLLLVSPILLKPFYKEGEQSLDMGRMLSLTLILHKGIKSTI